MASVIATTRAERNWVIGLVGAGHFFSHFVMLALPPLFLIMKPELDVSYAALGAIVSVLAVTTGAGQLPMGFLVDRIGGRAILIIGLVVVSAALILVGLTTSYWALFSLFAVAGIGNSVFHPADYAILTARLDDSVFGRAVSIHAFTGYLGWALAAVVMLPLAVALDWRMALTVVGVVGILIVVAMLAGARLLDDRPARIASEDNRIVEPTRVRGGVREGLALMASRPMLMMFLFFTLTATATSGIMSFSVVANVMLHEVDKIMAAGVLTAHLTASAVGVLIGGWLADRIRRHNLVTSLAIVAMAAALLLLAYDGIAVFVMTGAMVLGGLFYGISSPSRDVLVKQATPSGSAGVTFGFTSTGISVGNLIGPLLFGWVLDLGQPRLFFATLAGIIAVSVVTVMLTRPKPVAA